MTICNDDSDKKANEKRHKNVIKANEKPMKHQCFMGIITLVIAIVLKT